MSDWITDRRPTINDAYRLNVWVMRDGLIDQQHIHMVEFGEPWAPMTPPEPYVKPKRWQAKWNGTRWSLYYDGVWQLGLIRLNKQIDEHSQAAERIAAIYEEVMP